MASVWKPTCRLFKSAAKGRGAAEQNFSHPAEAYRANPLRPASRRAPQRVRTARRNPWYRAGRHIFCECCAPLPTQLSPGHFGCGNIRRIPAFFRKQHGRIAIHGKFGVDRKIDQAFLARQLDGKIYAILRARMVICSAYWEGARISLMSAESCTSPQVPRFLTPERILRRSVILPAMARISPMLRNTCSS